LKSKLIPADQGRSLFGLNPAGYDRVRPDYPDRLYDFLAERCGIDGTVPTLEIGAGTGIASRRLLSLGCSPIIALEPDIRFKPQLDMLAQRHRPHLTVLFQPFETADLASESFGLLLCATSFHWLNPERRVQRMAELVVPGGYVALLWNIFQDSAKEDAFHNATAALLDELGISPSGAAADVPFALRRGEREKEFTAWGFETAGYVEECWTLALDPAELGLLYESFSSIQQLPELERLALLDELKTIAEAEFDGVVERNMTSVCYLFRKPDGMLDG
jgi:SAM-dependent methyltransferase